MRFFRLLILPAGVLCALPTGPVVSEGEASWRYEMNCLAIGAGSFAEIHWDDFTIEAEEMVRFVQPDESSLAINRILSSYPSSIFGALEANGRIVLFNPNGILFGKNSRIDAGSLLASTLESAQGLFKESRKIIHEGRIACSSRLVFEALSIENRGLVASPEIVFRAQSAIDHFGELFAPGGVVKILGETNFLHADSLVDVSSLTGGGTILIGGDTRGQNPDIPPSMNTWVESGASLFANASAAGHGGKIILWSDASTDFRGRAEAIGAQDGGFIEISSKGYLNPNGEICARGMAGSPGTVLFDPCVVTLSVLADTTPFPYDFTGFAAANISIPVLNGILMGGTSVVIDAAATGTAPVGSITLNAAADVPAGMPVTWASLATLTLIADGSITLRNEISPMSAAFAAATPVVTLTAPVVTIGDPAHTLANPSGVTTFSGAAHVTAPTSLSLYGGSAFANEAVVRTSVAGPGNIVISAGTVLLEAGMGPAFINSILGSIDLSATGDLSAFGGMGMGSAGIATDAGPVTIFGGGNVTLVSGGGTSTGANIAARFGDLFCQIPGDYFLTGGTATMGSQAGIGVVEGTGTFRISGSNYFLSSGTTLAGGNPNGVFLGTVNMGSGDVYITATGSTGIVLNSFGSNLAVAAAQNSGNGTIVTTNLVLNGSPTVGAMGGAGFLFFAGNLNLTASGNISATGGGGVISNLAGIFAAGAGSAINIATNNITLTGGSGANCNASINSFAGPVTINLSGSYTLTGGPGDLSYATITTGDPNFFFPVPIGSGDLTLSGVNYTLTGGAGSHSIGGIGTGDPANFMPGGDGSVFLAASGQIVITGGGAGEASAIFTRGTLPTNAIDIEGLGASSSLTLNSGTGTPAAILTLGGEILISMPDSLFINSTPIIDSFISIGALGASDITILLGNSAFLNSFIENLGSGALTLVVDQNFPSPSLETAGSFWVQRPIWRRRAALFGFSHRSNFSTVSQDRRPSMGFPSSPEPPSSTRIKKYGAPTTPRRSADFPSLFSTSRAKLSWASQASIIDSEFLEKLHPTDEFPGWWKRFTLSSGEFLTPYFITVRQIGFSNPKSYSTSLHDTW